MIPRRPARASLGSLLPLLTALGCAPSFLPARPSEPVASAAGARRATVDRVLLTDDIARDGLGAGSALAFELSLTNSGDEPWTVSGALFSCVMVLDPERPNETRSLTPVGGAEGRFPGEVPGEGSLVGSFTVPPGQTRSYWVLFRGYRFSGSDLPRRVVLRAPNPGGRPLELVVADPARGGLRWQIWPRRGSWNVGFQNVSLFGEHLRGTVVSTVFARREDLGRVYLDVGLVSAVLIETHGHLASETSSFAGLGPSGHLTVPFARWGAELDPGRLGLYAGGSAMLLTEVLQQPRPDPMAVPTFYGVFTVEGGLSFDAGALRFAATPFPLSPQAPPAPRWSVRVGYTHWWVGGGGTDGYTSSFRLVW